MSFYKSFEVLLLLSLQFNCQFGHWVDVPEFSDDDKVYRLPSSKRSVIFKYPKVPASSKLDDDFTLKNHSDDHPSRFLMERDPYEIFNVPKSIVSSTTTTSSAAESYYPSEFSEASTEDSLREFAKRLDKIHETRDKVEEDEEEFEIEESYSVKKAHPGSPADNFTLKKSPPNRQQNEDPTRRKHPHDSYTTKRPTTQRPHNNAHATTATKVKRRPDHKIHRQEFTTLMPETQHLANEELFDDLVTTTSSPIDIESVDEDIIDGEKSTEKGFLEFMPLDIMKKVHLILKSQDPTVAGKMRFLKSFQRILYNEIGDRLTSLFAPKRKIREAGFSHHDHSFSDEEEDKGIGFPSIEGALLAISFLTFAAHLVQMVMMLFENINMNSASPNRTAFLFGRRRRSADDQIYFINNETVRILDSLESLDFED